MTESSPTSKVSNPGDSLDGLVRHNFERWISGPPFEYSIERFPENPSIFGWPGNYKNVAVDLAWAAWQDAWSENARLRQLLETSDRLLFGFGLGNNSPHRQEIADILSNVPRQVSLAGWAGGSHATGAKALGLLFCQQALCLSGGMSNWCSSKLLTGQRLTGRACSDYFLPLHVDDLAYLNSRFCLRNLT